MICLFYRTDKDQSKGKRKKIENDKPVEELYENKVFKMMEEKDGKSVRMLLPIKTKNGVLEKRFIEEEITNEEDNETTTNNQEENEESNEEENSDMEVTIDTHVRLNSI